MKKCLLLLASTLSVILLAGCNTSHDNTLSPAPLVKFQPKKQVRTLWQQNTGNGSSGYYLRLVPAADQGMIFTGSHNGIVTAVNAKTGAIVWQRNIGEPISSGVAAGDGAVYLGTSNAQLFALSEKSGQIRWHQKVTNEVLAQPRYTKGRVLIHTTSGALAAYSARTGKLDWRFNQQTPSLTLHAAGQPQVAGNNVVAGFANGELAVLNLTDGHLKWERHVAFPTGDNPISQMVDITVNPVVVDGIVYAATYQGQVAAFSLDDGQLLWRHKISSYAGITANQSQVLVSDAKSHVWAFDEDSGSVDWKQSNLTGRHITGPVIYKNTVVVADNYGYLHFMNLSEGQFVARTSLGGGALAQPVTYRGNLYVYTSQGNLIAVHAS